MGSFGIWHLLILGAVVFFFFGKNRLPAIGRGFGRFVRGFKEGMNDIDIDSRPVKEISEDSPSSKPADQKKKDS